MPSSARPSGSRMKGTASQVAWTRVGDEEQAPQQHGERDDRIDEGARDGDPGEDLRREDRPADDVLVLGEEQRRAIGDFGEEVEDDQADEDREGIVEGSARRARRRPSAPLRRPAYRAPA